MDDPKLDDWRSKPRKTDAQRFSHASTLRLPRGTKETLRQLASKWDCTEAETIRCLIEYGGKRILQGQTDAILAPRRVQRDRAREAMAVMRGWMRQADH